MTIVNKVFIDDLPRWEGGTWRDHGVTGTVNWKKSVGEKVHFVYNDIEGNIDIVGYNPDNRNVIVKYNDNIPFEMTAASFRQCRLGGLLKNEKEYKYDETDLRRVDLRGLPRSWNGIDWKESIGEKFEYFYDGTSGFIEILDYKMKNQRLNLKCNNKLFELATTDILSCKIGNVIGKWNTDHLYKIGDILHTNHCIIEIVECFRKYEKSHKGNMKWYKYKCTGCGWEGGEIRENDLKTKKKGSCPKCGDGNSYPNKIGFNILEQLEVIFKCEYSPDWIKPKRYDFYFILHNKEYIVEMDGGFHNKHNYMNGQTADEINRLDNHKEKLANQHGIKVIRIDCRKSELDYIKNNTIDSLLSSLFNLDKINWQECHKYASTSRIYKVAEIYNSNKKLTPKDISVIMNVSSVSARKYLRIAHELNLCDFTFNKGSSKRIKVKYNDSTTIYNSSAELSKASLDVYGFFIHRSTVSNVLKDNKPYKNLEINHV